MNVCEEGVHTYLCIYTCLYTHVHMHELHACTLVIIYVSL